MKNFLELLAPAGSPAAAYAALAYGADAVYAGLPEFSARAEADNFSPAALDELIGYAHHLGRRVYITFNTLVQQRELAPAYELLAQLRDMNVDGVIVQDAGVVRLIQKNFPQLALHASTQFSVHNLAGARQLKELGFKRVVLARELGLAAIEHISRNCGIETEVFVHGALCYSYSGLCLFSSHMLGRSGNRGRCAYCCRQPFRTGGGSELLPFSMKDFSAAEHLPALTAAGVASLKIEGRMKSPLYVAAVSDYYRRLLDGKLNAGEREKILSDIQTIFGRPATDLYLCGENKAVIDSENSGHLGAQIGTVEKVENGWLIFTTNRALEKHDGLKISGDGFAANEIRLASDSESRRRFELPADAEIAVKLPAEISVQTGAPVYCSYSQAVRRRYEFTTPRPGEFRQRRPLNISIQQSAERIVFTGEAAGVRAEFILEGNFEPARNPEKAAAAFRQSFEKLGDTDWRLNEFVIAGAPVFVPVSVLNDARRRLISAVDEAWRRQECLRKEAIEEFIPNQKQEQIKWSVKARRLELLEKVCGADELILEIDLARLDEVEKARTLFPAEKLRLALPVIVRDEDLPAFEKVISENAGAKWEAANIGALNLLKNQKSISADWPLYTLNSGAATFWFESGIQQVVLSPEDDSENLFELISRFGGGAAVVTVFQYSPLMISATPPAVDAGGLIDRSHRRFSVERNGNEFVLIAQTPFSLSEQLNELKSRGAKNFRIDLSYGISSPDTAADVVRRFISGESVAGDSANFLRELQ